MGIGIITLAFQLVFAIKAMSACNGKRDDDPVPFFTLLHQVLLLLQFPSVHGRAGSLSEEENSLDKDGGLIRKSP